MFLVGRPNDRENLQKLTQENAKFNDIVVINIEEVYYSNPTLKMIIAFKFVSCFCPNANYFVKSDDDNFIDMHRLDILIARAEATLELSRLKILKTTGSGSPSTGGFYMGFRNFLKVHRLILNFYW